MTDPNPDFYHVMTSWMSNETIPAIVSGYPDTCTVTVLAPMIAKWNCTESSHYINYTAALPGNYSWDQETQNPALENRTTFYTNVWLTYNSTERVPALLDWDFGSRDDRYLRGLLHLQELLSCVSDRGIRPYCPRQSDFIRTGDC